MIGELLLKLLEKNRNDQQVKQAIQEKVSRRESTTYHLMSSEAEQKFLQEYARTNIQQQRLQDVSALALDRLSRVASSIEKGQLELPRQEEVAKEHSAEPVPQPNVADSSLSVQLRSRQEYPIAANYDYWSQKHNKAEEVRQYMHRLHEQDRKIKEEIHSKKLSVQESKRRKQEQQQHEQTLLQQQKKQEIRQQALSKINQLKEEKQRRMEKEEEFQKFYEEYKSKAPLHAKLQEQYKRRFQLPMLEQRKLKLENIRNIRKQPSLTALKEHMRKHNQAMQARQSVTITNDPVQVSFRSRYHSTLEPNTDQDSRELYEKKQDYGKKVREEFKPTTSPRLVEQMQQRLEPKDPLSKRRQQLKKPGGGNSEQDEDEDQDNPREKASKRDSDEDEDEDGDSKAAPQQEQPQCSYRNRLGNNYLDFVRGLKKKNRPTKQDYIRRIEEEERLQAESKKPVIRPNYLNDLREQRRSYSVTAKSPFDNWQSDLHDSRLNEIDKKRRVFMKSQQITQKAQRRELQIAHDKLNQNQLLEERQKVDLQYLEAIRAKLALMQV